MAEPPPIRRELVVGLAPQDAFDLFTGEIGAWWPLGELSVFGAEGTVAFVDGRIVETCGDRSSEWGSVTSWEPGARVSFTWHPGRPSAEASSVSVTFSATGSGGTLVVLEHSGWEVFADPAAARQEYSNGWPMVLDRYARATGDAAGPDAHTWVALLHRPGPAAPTTADSIFTDPRFGDHTRFLASMMERGYLFAAGPMLDEPGAGMTILRLPGTDRLDEAARLAREEDKSVTAGFFEVTVRPWRVMMAGS
jgi:uncharacterized protein YndB with AHSA1/START domain/uncharacterized protein YciI